MTKVRSTLFILWLIVCTPSIGHAQESELDIDKQEFEYEHDLFVEAMTNFRSACSAEDSSPSDRDIFADYVRLQDENLADLDGNNIHANARFLSHFSVPCHGQSFYGSVLGIQAERFIGAGVPAMLGGAALVTLGVWIFDRANVSMSSDDSMWNMLALDLFVRPYGAIATIGGCILTGFGFAFLIKASGIQKIAKDGNKPSKVPVQATVSPGQLTLRW